jgi:hypothetical protein
MAAWQEGTSLVSSDRYSVSGTRSNRPICKDKLQVTCDNPIMCQIIRRISQSIPCFAKTLLVILLITSAPTHGIETHKNGDDDSPLLAGTHSDGTVQLSAEIQEMAGVVVRSVGPSRYRHEKKPFGKVVTQGSLIELSELYGSASAAERAFSAQWVAAKSSYRRLGALFAKGQPRHFQNSGKSKPQHKNHLNNT